MDREVTLMEMLEAREVLAGRQRELLERYARPVVSFTLNIAGPVKNGPVIRRAFREEIPGTTKLIIAQRIRSVQDADRILVLDEGHVSAFGSHEELLKTSAIYREVWESQTGAGNGDFDRMGGED